MGRKNSGAHILKKNTFSDFILRDTHAEDIVKHGKVKEKGRKGQGTGSKFVFVLNSPPPPHIEYLLRLGVMVRLITSVGWQVTLCDPIWHVSFP